MEREYMPDVADVDERGTGSAAGTEDFKEEEKLPEAVLPEEDAGLDEVSVQDSGDGDDEFGEEDAGGDDDWPDDEAFAMPGYVDPETQERMDREKQAVSEMKQKRKHAQKISFRILIVITVVVAAYIIYAIATKNVNVLIFQILLSVFVISYMLLSDVLEPLLYGGFENIDEVRKMAFIKMLAMDIIGTGALMYWIVMMSSDDSSNFLIPVLIYFFTLQFKRRFRDEFDGIAKSSESKEEK